VRSSARRSHAHRKARYSREPPSPGPREVDKTGLKPRVFSRPLRVLCFPDPLAPDFQEGWDAMRGALSVLKRVGCAALNCEGSAPVRRVPLIAPVSVTVSVSVSAVPL